jgi:hypothetical protein
MDSCGSRSGFKAEFYCHGNESQSPICRYIPTWLNYWGGIAVVRKFIYWHLLRLLSTTTNGFSFVRLFIYCLFNDAVSGSDGQMENHQ